MGYKSQIPRIWRRRASFFSFQPACWWLVAAVTEWQKKNPNWSNSEIGVDKYIKYVNYITSDYSKEKNQDKFVKIIAKETILNKL